MNTDARKQLFGASFPNTPAVLIVVHVVDVRQTLESVAAAIEGGADGCFLIHHGQDQMLLRRAYRKARAANPNLWIGLNFLGKNPATAARLANMPHTGTATRMPGGGEIPRPNGLWVDNPLAVEHFRSESASCRGPSPEGFLDIHAPEISVHRQDDATLELGGLPSALYFAGAAFKHQPDKGVSLAQESQIVARRSDVVTTSGDRTGQPPTVAKIAMMRGAIGPDVPLAIASGIDAANARLFCPYVQAFLVATSVTEPGSELTIAAKVRELVDAVKG